MSLLPFLHRVAARESLSFEDAREAMTVLLEGGVSDAVIAGFLVALRMKGEPSTELAGFAQAMREKSVFVDAGEIPGNGVIDIVGTGGDDAGTFNISTVRQSLPRERARAWPNTAIARFRDAWAARMCSKRWASGSP